MWHWPLPSHVPWELPRGKADGSFGLAVEGVRNTGLTLHNVPNHTPVCAVEDGVVHWLGPDGSTGIIIKGASGQVLYTGCHSALQSGRKIKAGQSIGVNGNQLGVHVSPTGKWGRCLEEKPMPDYITDPTPLLMEAWCRVTNRFHREQPRQPQTAKQRRELLLWLHQHPIWTHPYPIRVPPNEGDYFGEPVGEGKFKLTPLISDGPDWTDEVIETGGMEECLSFDFVYVDPTVETIRGNSWGEDLHNIAFRVWIEAGGWYDRGDPEYTEHEIEPEGGWTKHNRWVHSHDLDLDCGAETMEEALVQLALRVKFFYGEGKEHRTTITSQCEGKFENWGEEDEKYLSGCADGGDGFCSTCGHLIRLPYEEEEDEE
jgi:hypothetical protein